MEKQYRMMTMWLTLFLLSAAGLLFSCIDMTPTYPPGLDPSQPNYLTNKYLADLKDGTDSERIKAAWELGKPHLKRTPEVVPALINALDDPNPKVRSNAADALSHIGEEARPAENALRRALNDPYGRTVLNAAITLRRLNVPDKELIPAVRQILSDEMGSTRVWAAHLLRIMGVKDEKILTVLAQVLSDPDEQAKLDALKELNDLKLKPIPKIISDPAIQLLEDDGENVRIQAAIYLGNSYIPIPAAKAPLTKALNDSSPFVAKFAARALAKYGGSAQQVFPKLLLILKTHPDEDVRGEVCETLGHIGIPREEIAVVLVNVLSTDSGAKARYGAAAGLRTLKYRSAVILNALKMASIQDMDSSVRTISSITYKQLGGK